MAHGAQAGRAGGAAAALGLCGAILLILAVSVALSQVTPLAVGYLTDQVLQAKTVDFQAVIPILLGILVVNVVNEVVKVIR